jgi:ABC-type branched-subunit amino acid transport system permease subunit
MAGMAGALLTQTNQFVGLNVLGFEPSGELLVMLILGGVGRLYGAFVGPLVFLVAQDFLAKKFSLVPQKHSNGNRWFKIVIMDHVEIDQLSTFIDDLKVTLHAKKGITREV